VTATGERTKFGRTAELVRTAHVQSSQQKTVIRVVRNLAACNGAIILLMIGYAYFLKMPAAEIIPLALTGQAILTPMLMVIIMITGDLLGMSLTTDNVRASPWI